MTLLNLISFYFSFTILTIFYVIPNLGFTRKSDLSDSDYVLVYPHGYMIYAFVNTFVKVIYLGVSSRGYIFRSIFRPPQLHKKLANLVLFTIGAQFDYSQFPREEPPLVFLWEKEVEIRENWVDNQESQHVFVLVRFAY